MCGIIGIVGETQVPPLLIEGLKRLEYRGYDSSGIATLTENGELLCRRAEGKLGRLEHAMQADPIYGTAGIGHTRWATHGKPTTQNAHPHITDKVAVVHNGIIENFRELRILLESEGRVFGTETDTEVIPHLITYYMEQGMVPEEAVALAVQQLKGTFALAILFAGKDKVMMAARRGSPLAIGHGEGRMCVGSDMIALSPFTSRITYLEDGDLAHISLQEAKIFDENLRPVERTLRHSDYASVFLGKGNYRHFMLKEIHEQPEMLAASFNTYVDAKTKEVRLPELSFNLADVSQLTLVACGTSHYAGMVGKYWMERYAQLPVALDIASEFRYRDTPLPENGLALFISQSGETADTLAALRFAKEKQQHIMSLVNVMESSMARASDAVLPIAAGAEIGVASTKAFTSQLMALACLTLACAEARGTLARQELHAALNALGQLPALLTDIARQEKELQRVSHILTYAQNVLYIGRGTSYALALEGALKLKELTYIHAEGIAAGELKHGPIALVDDKTPVIAIAPSDHLFEKTYSNIQEVSARGGKIIALTDPRGAELLKDIALRTIVLPETHPMVTPILYAVPLQLLAYQVAVAKGNDVDQPRNLAKSVTVE